ncbi:MAG: universal stress protein [Deltaproteobacteria bacterium]|nr:MAG: universal stress protein [Deltaproteobacteria bacterium]
MPEVNKILVAICFSDYCPGTFAYATRLATQLQAELVVANIINIKDVQAIGRIESMGYAISAEEYVKGVKEERREELGKMVADSGFPKEKLKSIFKVGHPFEELLKITKEEKVDMVVMGAKGRSNVEHLLVGSVAEKMFRHSPVTVASYRRR